MAEQADAPEREDELNLEIEADTPEVEQDQEVREGQDPPEPEGEDEFEISFGDEAAPASRGESSDLVRHLRAEVRKRDEELAGLRKAQPAPAVAEVGPKPTLENCDYDGDRFETELDQWKERKRKADEANTQTQQAAQAEQEKFRGRLQVFQAGKEALKAKDFDVAEAAVTSCLSQVQQAIALKAAADPAKVLYALGRHPQKLAELAKLNDPIEFAVAVSKLEGTLKVTQRGRTPPDPDAPIRGAAPLTKGVDRNLERLEAEAARTNDRSKVIAYKRDLKAKGKS